MALNDERLGEPREQTACKLTGARAAAAFGRGVGNNDGEFVAREPADDGLVRELFGQSFGHGLERGVTGEMTEGIVDVLEIIDVDVEQAEFLGGALGPRDRLLQQVLELHSIGNPGQRVDAGQISNSLLRAPPLGDVLRGVDSIAGLGLLTFQHRTGVGDRYRFGELTHEERFVRQPGRRVLPQRTLLLRVDQVLDGRSHQFFRLVAQEVRRRAIDALDRPVATGDDDRVVHAGKDTVDVVPAERGLSQSFAHRVEHRGEFTEFVIVACIERFAEIGGAQAFRLALEFPDPERLVSGDDPDDDTASDDGRQRADEDR